MRGVQRIPRARSSGHPPKRPPGHPRQGSRGTRGVFGWVARVWQTPPADVHAGRTPNLGCACPLSLHLLRGGCPSNSPLPRALPQARQGVRAKPPRSVAPHNLSSWLRMHDPQLIRLWGRESLPCARLNNVSPRGPPHRVSRVSLRTFLTYARPVGALRARPRHTRPFVCSGTRSMEPSHGRLLSHRAPSHRARPKLES